MVLVLCVCVCGNSNVVIVMPAYVCWLVKPQKLFSRCSPLFRKDLMHRKANRELQKLLSIDENDRKSTQFIYSSEGNWIHLQG